LGRDTNHTCGYTMTMRVVFATIAAAVLVTVHVSGCSNQVSVSSGGHRYIRISKESGDPSQPHQAELWQRAGVTGKGLPVYIRPLGSKDQFISSGVL